jgi:hypothetical protein
MTHPRQRPNQICQAVTVAVGIDTRPLRPSHPVKWSLFSTAYLSWRRRQRRASERAPRPPNSAAAEKQTGWPRSDCQAGRRDMSSQHISRGECFEITLEATKPREHGVAGTFGRVARPMRQMRRDVHLPTLTRLGGPLRWTSAAVEAMFSKYRIPFLDVLMHAR